MYLAPTTRKPRSLELEIFKRHLFKEFVLWLLEDVTNRKWDAWSKFLRGPCDDEDDFAYWHRWMQLKTEIGEE